jgi:hypothetical protein
MLAAQRKIPVIHGLFAVAGVVAAAAGYWFGSAGRTAEAWEEGQGTSGRAHRERTMVAQVPALSPVELVGASLKGTLDRRGQWQTVRWLSEEEVKAAIAELGNIESSFSLDFHFKEMLYYRWGELNPERANAVARVKFPKGFSSTRQAVIAAWIKQGGAVEAWNAVKDEGEIWACTRSVPGEVAEMVVASLSDRDDEAAFKEVLRLNDENSEIADTLCRARARKAFAASESRTAFLAAASKHPKPFVRNCAYQFLFREWAKSDLEAARTGASSMKIPEEYADTVRREIDSAERDRKSDSERTGTGE